MIHLPPVVSPDATLKDATQLMKDHKVRCLPVVKNQELLGLITHQHIMKIEDRLL